MRRLHSPGSMPCEYNNIRTLCNWSTCSLKPVPAPEMDKYLLYIAAAVFGWIFYSLPKVLKNTMTWTFMLSCIGLAAVVGFISGSILTYLFPKLPSDVACSLCSVLGAGCTYWMDRFTGFAKATADRVEGNILDRLGSGTQPGDTPLHTPDTPSGDRNEHSN